MNLRLRADDCADLPSMENWLNAGADWTEHHGIEIAASGAPELFYETQAGTVQTSTASLFERLQKESEDDSSESLTTTHPFLKLDTLQLCKDQNPLQLVRSGSSSMVDSSSNEEELSEAHVANSGLLEHHHRHPNYDMELNLTYMEADSPRGPLSPAALQLGQSPRCTNSSSNNNNNNNNNNKRPFEDLSAACYPPFVAMANSAAPTTTYTGGNVAPVPGILFPAPLTLPNVPSMEEIAQSRPKRRNVKISTDPQSVAARHRRERISDRVRVLQHFVPGGTKMDTASMLDEAIHYVKFLQQQLQTLERLGNSYDARFMTQAGVSPDVMNMLPQMGSSSAVRPFDLNCAVYQTFPMQPASTQQPQNNTATTVWPVTTSAGFGIQSFPDSPQEQFCH